MMKSMLAVCVLTMQLTLGAVSSAEKPAAVA